MTDFMRIFFIILILASAGLVTFTGSTAYAVKAEHIAATVNEDAISTSELQDRLRLMVISTGQRPTKEILQRMTPQILGSLIDEQIQLQEAKRLNLEVSAQEIRVQFEDIARRNNTDPDQFEQMLKRNDINIETMRDQIRAQIAWAKVIQSKLRPQVNITDNDVQNQIDRYTRAIGKEEYLLAKIFLPVEGEKKNNNVRKLSQDLITQIRAGKARFSRVAQQFSKAPGAHKGGDMGWVQEGQLEPELNDILRVTKPGEISDAIRLSDGYHIILVREKRLITEENIPTKEQIVPVLGTARLERLQRRYLLDLKATAFIDVRV